jgi:hypothetical protein
MTHPAHVWVSLSPDNAPLVWETPGPGRSEYAPVVPPPAQPDTMRRAIAAAVQSYIGSPGLPSIVAYKLADAIIAGKISHVRIAK